MDKRGFTLTEILGVIVIIGLLLLIVAPNLLNRINPKEEKITKIQKTMLEEAAGLYADAHKDRCSSSCTISVKTLKAEGYINDNVSKASDKSNIDDKVTITVINSNGKRVFDVAGY